MDSGSAVPTLSPGLSVTVAVKLLTVARVRCGGWPARRLSWETGATIADAAGLTLLLRAFFLAADSAGRSNAARTDIITTTTSSSISVKARWGIFINHLVSFLHES